MKVLVDLSHVDWELLRNQKNGLFSLSTDNTLTTQETSNIDGILNLLDHIQDEAVKQLGEKTVFGK